MSDITLWPYPRMLQSNYNTYYLYVIGTDLYLALIHYTTENYYAIHPQMNLGLSSDINDVHIADFGYFFVVSTIGVSGRQTFYRLYTEAITSDPTEVEVPVIGCVLNHKGQFVGGNILETDTGNWAGVGSNGIIWGAIGDFNLAAEQNVGAGYMQLSLGGGFSRKQIIYKLMTLGNAIATYTDAGIRILKPAFVNGIFTYGEEPLPGDGITSSLHACGTDLIQGFIDRNKEFYIMGADLQVTKLGYREQITDILAYTNGAIDVRTIISYHSRNRTFYISNGNTCLCINSYGGHFAHQMVSGLAQRQDGTIIGTFSDNLDREARILSDTLDFGTRSIKSVETLLANISCDVGVRGYLGVDYRYTKSSAFHTGAWKYAGLNGEARIGIAAAEFQLKFKFDEYVGSEISGLVPNIKYSDNRFNRGTTPTRGRANEAVATTS